MRFNRPVIALNARRFGRRPLVMAARADQQAPLLSDDMRLFAGTFTAGFLLVSILIA